MDEVQLNPAQRNILPYLLALTGAVVGILGLLTPWLSIGARGISGSSSNPGKLTYLVISSLVVLGLGAFIDQLRNYKKVIALVTMAICFDVLASYAIWANQAFSAIGDFNDAAGELNDLGGLFGGALSSLADSIEPSITTGFYMVCASAVIGIVSSVLVFRQPKNQNSEDLFNPDIDAIQDEISMKHQKQYFGVPQTPFFITLASAVLGLAVVVAGSGSSELNKAINSNLLNPFGSNSTESEDVSSDVFNCLEVRNTKNSIKLNQSSFSGDPSPSDIFVATQFRITNNCGKAVIGIKGTMIFQNVVGDEVFTGNYTDDKTINIGESFTSSLDYGWTFNEFENEHGVLAGTDESKTKAILKLTKVAFDDGTSLSG